MPTMQYLHAIYKHKNINNNTYIMGDVFMDGKNKRPNNSNLSCVKMKERR